MAALHDFDCPQQNVVFADTSGTIGFVAAGRVPVRKAIFAGSQMPAPGWSGDYDWTGLLPFDELPQALSPPSGLIATANNDIRPPGYVPFITGRWEAPYRIGRIDERLGETDKHSVLSMASMQMDTVSLAARQLLPALLPLLPRDCSDKEPLAATARTLLEAWDDRMDRDQPEPLIYEAWLNRLGQRIFGDELGDLYKDVWFWDAESLHRVLRDTPAGAARWCDDRTTADKVEDCAFEARQAFDEALAALRRAYGDDMRQWRWGRGPPGRLRQSRARPHPAPRPASPAPASRSTATTTRSTAASPAPSADGAAFPRRARRRAARHLRFREPRRIALHPCHRPVGQPPLAALRRHGPALARRQLRSPCPAATAARRSTTRSAWCGAMSVALADIEAAAARLAGARSCARRRWRRRGWRRPRAPPGSCSSSNASSSPARSRTAARSTSWRA